MPRANRFFLPGHVWHLTQRCHKRAFLLRFACDRRRWCYWLLQSRLRYGLCVLNYAVTSNHVHLLVYGQGEGEIARSMQLIAGRTGQEFNQRKARSGAFWQDRYHATAVESGVHLARRMAYIDLNMVRAGAVNHPREWIDGGYHEVLVARRRNQITSIRTLIKLIDLGDREALVRHRDAWIADSLSQGRHARDAKWTESKAIGSAAYVRHVSDELRVRAPRSQIISADSRHRLREPSPSYGALFCMKKRVS